MVDYTGNSEQTALAIMMRNNYKEQPRKIKIHTSATSSSFVTGERNSMGTSFDSRERNFSILGNLLNTLKIQHPSDNPYSKDYMYLVLSPTPQKEFDLRSSFYTHKTSIPLITWS